MIAVLVIETKPGECFPGTIQCDCGGKGLTVWHKTLGTVCPKCAQGFAFQRAYDGPGTYPLKPQHARLRPWGETVW